MDTPSHDTEGVKPPVVKTPEIDPLRRNIDPLKRVFVPIEKRTSKGTLVFRTLDGDIYARLDDGSIRRARKKVNGKVARKQRAKARMHGA